MTDDDLELFEANGAPPLPSTAEHGSTDHDGASIWYASFGAGSPVILLHGGLGHSGNWGHQVPDLIAAGHQVIVIDSRGHGRSTRDARPFSYELMASDVLAVMDQLGVRRAGLERWGYHRSDHRRQGAGARHGCVLFCLQDGSVGEQTV